MQPAMHHPKRWRVRFALLGGAVAWAVHLLAAWALSEWRCLDPFAEPRLLGVTPTAWLLLGLSLLMLAASVAASWVGRVDSMSLREETGPARYLARAGFLTSAVFALVIAFQTAPIFYFLGGC